ncbi:DUF6069 family protein [Halomarina pelagica]|uniref:DUF6069 family protein n=1 Tax=Halomarina pelagica TaxID=2961599 RepID=UPI0020C34E7F|nr:DUF6069 family protein [Halomarina sp. BND7]
MPTAETPRESVVTPARSSRDLLVRGALALVVAVLGAALVRLVAGALLVVPAGFDPMGWTPIVTSSAVAAVGATLVYAVLTRLVARPDRWFVAVAAVVLALSALPLVTVAPGLPGATTELVAVLGVMHLVVGVGIVVALVRGTKIVAR